MSRKRTDLFRWFSKTSSENTDVSPETSSREENLSSDREIERRQEEHCEENDDTAERATTSNSSIINPSQVVRSKDKNYQQEIADLPHPYQPNSFNFPRNKDGRCFQVSWFKRFSWIHYDCNSDSAFCFTCIKALALGALSSNNVEASFVSTGYKNWRKACDTNRKFSKHELSDAHKEADNRVFATVDNLTIGQSLSSPNNVLQQERKREALMKIFKNIRYLALQGISFRGNWSKLVGAEFQSNFYQLNALVSQYDESLKMLLKSKGSNYTSSEIQNEMLELLANHIRRDVARNIRQNKIYTVMADETADVANVEQLVVCLRWVDDCLEAHEEFMGVHSVENTKADTIHRVLKDILLRFGLPISDARGQCYDGAAAMAGKKRGVASLFKQENSKMFYTHCHGHALNLAVKDACCKIDILKDTFEISREIIKLVKDSPMRNAKLNELRSKSNNGSKSVHAFCPTRWTVRGETLNSVLENF